MAGLNRVKRRADAKRLGRVSAALQRDIDMGHIHGAAMRVSMAGEVILDFLGGYADKAAGKPLAPDSVFVTMSVAKPFTNVLALSLVEKGLLKMHAPVAEVIPEFAQFGKESVSLFHLMTHTSGVMSGMPPVPPDVLTNIEKLTNFLCSTVLECLPGERVNYVIVVAQSIIAAMCLRVDGRGRSYATMLKEDIFDPLGMPDSNLGPRTDLLPRLCPVRGAQDVPYNVMPSAMWEAGFNQVFLTPGAELPGAGCMTTMDDVHRFTEMLRLGGALDGVRVLSPAMLDYCSRNFTGTMRNAVWDPSVSARHWQPFYANLGIGFLVRGEGVRPGPFGMLNSPRTFGGFGSGSTGIWVDPESELSYSLLSTGLLEESHHLERTGTLSDMVMSALID